MMTFYPLFRKILFKLDPEKAHDLSLTALRYWGKIFDRGTKAIHPIEIMGLRFPNRIGLAAGFDKNALALKALAYWGFGHLEVGTFTPKFQKGGDKPRLFRLEKEEALINRMGFNNCGIEKGIEHIAAAGYRGILGINIGKGKETPLEKAEDDYCYGLKIAYPYASYVTLNISSPNTEKLRDLQEIDALRHLLKTLKETRAALQLQYKKYVPLVVKISPDLPLLKLIDIAYLLKEEKIDGIIATNTTLNRSTFTQGELSKEHGGLSGTPLREIALQVLMTLANLLKGEIPIIASGGIMTAEDAEIRIKAGASLVQIYTGWIYKGPALIKAINKRIKI